MAPARSKARPAPVTSESLSGTNLTRAGDYNQRVTLQAIRANGSATRAELTTITGLTPPAIGNITARLHSDGLIKPDGRVLGGRGQPALKFVVDPEGAFSLGLNIDRDHISLVAMDFTGAIRDRAILEAKFALPGEVLTFVQTQLKRIKRQSRINTDRLIGIGIGIPDNLGNILLPHRPEAYHEWAQIDVCRFFSEALGLPAYSENDATAAAVGELQFGSGRGRQHFILTLISAGLGSGLIINGQPYRGADNCSGEIAFIAQSLFAGGAPQGILQDKVSLYALYDYLAERGFQVSDPVQLADPAPDCRAAIDAWIEMTADLLLGPFAVMNCAFNPERHYIASRMPAPVIERLCDRLNTRLRQALPLAPNIAPFAAATAAEDAAPMGAAVLVFQNRLLPRPEALKKTLAS